MERARRSDLGRAIRALLEDGFSGTQEDLCEALGGQGFVVNQSTVSRTLRKLGAVKSLEEGGVVYRLPQQAGFTRYSGALDTLVRSIEANESTIVIHTVPGSASFVAEFLDHARLPDLLGTIAGDDTIFVVPKSIRTIAQAKAAIETAIQG